MKILIDEARTHSSHVIIVLTSLAIQLAAFSEIIIMSNTDPSFAPQKPTEPTLGTRITDDKGVVMVYVPAGRFLMGSTQQQVDEAFELAKKTYGESAASKGWFTPELPQHEVVITRPFWLDLTPVTNESFAQFVAEGGYKTKAFWTPSGWDSITVSELEAPYPLGDDLNDPQQPQIGVSWYEAYAYCQWRGGRLPTEAEWEWSARGKNNLIYPWGDEFDPDKVVWTENSDRKPARVGSKPAGASWVGALDMSGNVWEWVQTIFHQEKFPYPYQENDGRNEEREIYHRVARGGGWMDHGSMTLRSAYRSETVIGYVSTDRGFRAARSHE